MKILFAILIFLSLIKADEMSRIEAIVSDITQLRAEYIECQKELKILKQKNTVLKAELEYNKDLDKSNKALSKRIKELEKTIKKLRTNKDDFPELMMKNTSAQTIINFKAQSYVLTYDSIIYDGINGKKITKWVKSTSFTSSSKTQHWIKVSGYFVNKKWTPAKKSMWIKIKQVEKK